MGGRVAPKNTGSAMKPALRLGWLCTLMVDPYVQDNQTPKSPRTHVTIVGAPKITPIPTSAPTGHAQEMRPVIATTASTMIASTANGVAIAVKFVTKLSAPVWKGLAAWAKASAGMVQQTTSVSAFPMRLRVELLESRKERFTMGSLICVAGRIRPAYSGARFD